MTFGTTEAAVSTEQAFAGRPPSATTSRLSVAGNRDYGMKFDLGADEMTNSATLSRPTQDGASDRSVPAMPTPPETEAAWGPPSYQKATSRQGDRDDESEAECHPFWMSWVDMARGIGLIMAGALKIPFVIGHGIAKVLWSIPVLYGDDSIWAWPNITGFPMACKASMASLWYGLYQGLTDWAVLPIKRARKEGVKGFIKGFFMGLGSIVFKPAAGCAGCAFHPFFGIYKEASKFKLIIKRDRHSRRRYDSPV